MGIYDTDDDDDLTTQPDDNNVVRQLRKALKAEQAKNKQFEDQLAELSKVTRSRTVADVLQQKGLTNPKIAKLIPSDVDASEAGITAWLDEYADVFGITTPEKQAPQIPANDLGALRDIDAVSMAQGQPGNADLAAKIRNAGSVEELNAILMGASG